MEKVKGRGWGKGRDQIGVNGRGRRKGKELGKGTGAVLKGKCGSAGGGRIWGGVGGWWDVKGHVYGKLGTL